MIKVHGAVLRYAIGLLDQVFPEYDGVFCKPFLTSVRALIREVGLTPKVLLSKKAEVILTLQKATAQNLRHVHRVEARAGNNGLKTIFLFLPSPVKNTCRSTKNMPFPKNRLRRTAPTERLRYR